MNYFKGFFILDLSEKIISFNSNLNFEGTLPPGISIMNPFKENPFALDISSKFYNKFYNDSLSRKLILGINPGRFGAGITGIPFTDTKRLKSHCGLEFNGEESHELSSVFVYDLIDSCGGPGNFYKRFFINSICPLGFLKLNEKGKQVNFNYYDSKALITAVEPFMIDSLTHIVSMGMDTDRVFVLGSGKNFKYIRLLNDSLRIFDKVVPIDHPRFIMQYKLKEKDSYIQKIINILNQ